jgi:hypothetical protein
MAVYRIYPTKDATIYSYYPERNTGLDEIVEASTTPSEFLDTGTAQTSRFLIQFSSTDIANVYNNLVGGAGSEVYLKLYAANVTNLSGTTVLECYPVSQSWNNGTGKLFDGPAIVNGVNWKYRSSEGLDPWATENYTPGSTGSYDTEPGGGTWYSGSDFVSTQVLEYSTPVDVNLNVSSTVTKWRAGTIPNNGFIIKQEQEFIDNVGYASQLKYYSRDTNTIYPPCLEFRWDDVAIINPIPPIITGDEIYVSLDNNVGTYRQDSIQIFRVNARPYYPARVFQTTSIYTTNYALPYDSYYAIQDVNTNEFIIDFSNPYTQLSIDPSGSYFKIYMSSLEPERYYKILIKTEIRENAPFIVDNNFLFKIVN